MNKVLTIIQPGYFPSITRIKKIIVADVCLLTDTFFYDKRKQHNRCLIKYAAGTKWLTVPVFHLRSGNKSLNNILIDDHEQWRKKHLACIRNSYIHAAYFYYYFNRIEKLLSRPYKKLVDINRSTLDFLLESLQIKCQLGNTINMPKIADRTDRLVTWLKECNCDTFLLEEFEIPLINPAKIKNRGLKIQTFKDRPFDYYQLFDNFIYPISALDVLLNEGPNAQYLMQQSITET